MHRRAAPPSAPAVAAAGAGHRAVDACNRTLPAASFLLAALGVLAQTVFDVHVVVGLVLHAKPGLEIGGAAKRRSAQARRKFTPLGCEVDMLALDPVRLAEARDALRQGAIFGCKQAAIRMLTPLAPQVLVGFSPVSSTQRSTHDACCSPPACSACGFPSAPRRSLPLPRLGGLRRRAGAIDGKPIAAIAHAPPVPYVHVPGLPVLAAPEHRLAALAATVVRTPLAVAVWAPVPTLLRLALAGCKPRFPRRRVQVRLGLVCVQLFPLSRGQRLVVDDGDPTQRQ